MKRLIPFGLCMALVGCLEGSGDGTDPATSSPTGTEAETAAEVAVTPRVGFGQLAPQSAAPNAGLVARPAIRQEREELEAEEVIDMRPVFSAENLKRTEAFRFRLGVQR